MMCRFTSRLLAVYTFAITVTVMVVFPPAIAFLSHDRPRHSSVRQLAQTTQAQDHCHLQPSSLCLAGSAGNDEDIIWNDAKVVSTKPACPSGKSLLWSIQLDNTDALSIGYHTPGQYLKLRWKESTDPLFLAMCSPPPKEKDDNVEKSALDFLVKTTSNIPWLTDIDVGATVQVSNVMGEGFAAAAEALKEVSGEGDEEATDTVDHVLLVAAGSGIAPLMACFRTKEWMDKVSYRAAYYGEWTFDDICFQDELTTEEAGINLVPCFSKQERDFTKGFWSGHVQMVMWQRGVVNPDKTLALVCGSTEMMEDVRQLLTRAGVKPERIVTNV